MEYKGMLMEDLQCDYESVSYWVQLVRKGPLGHMECLRILYHLIKDKSLASTFDDPDKAMAANNSKWLKNASLEALEALANPDDWEQGPAHNAKGASKGAWASYNPLAEPQGPGGKGKGKDDGTSSSSSSSTWNKQGWRG